MASSARITKLDNSHARKRRKHSKSRNGCGNCKLRHVKCDELRPQCSTCNSYGVACDFADNIAPLERLAQSAFQVEFTAFPDGKRTISTTQNSDELQVTLSTNQTDNLIASRPQKRSPFGLYGTSHVILTPVSINCTIASYINDSLLSGEPLDLESFSSRNPSGSDTRPQWFSEYHLDILSRFHARTSLTVGYKRTSASYRDIVCRQAFSHPFLMEMLLGLTLMHDSDLSLSFSSSLAAKQKHASLQHWDKATRLFNQLLASKYPPSYRDAIWATGVHIGAASFWYTESTDPLQAWPLKTSEPDDLAWMRLTESKKYLWDVADPSRPDSAFYPIMKTKSRHSHTPPDWLVNNGISHVPKAIQQLFKINEQSTKQNNIYLLPILILSHVQHLHLTHENGLDFLYLNALITPEFLVLLENKDRKAIFLIGWWYKTMRDGDLWWIARRAKIEGDAIRIWLQRNEVGLARLLEELVPRQRLSAGFAKNDWSNETAVPKAGRSPVALSN